MDLKGRQTKQLAGEKRRCREPHCGIEHTKSIRCSFGKRNKQSNKPSTNPSPSINPSPGTNPSPSTNPSQNGNTNPSPSPSPSPSPNLSPSPSLNQDKIKVKNY